MDGEAKEPAVAVMPNDALALWRSSGKMERILDRHEEYKLMEEAFLRLLQQGDPIAGPPEVIFLTSSAAGLGKSTLVRRLEQRVQEACGFFVTVDCQGGGFHPDPHAPLIHTLSSWAQILYQNRRDGGEQILQTARANVNRPRIRLFDCRCARVRLVARE